MLDSRLYAVQASMHLRLATACSLSCQIVSRPIVKRWHSFLTVRTSLEHWYMHKQRSSEDWIDPQTDQQVALSQWVMLPIWG